MTLSRITIFLLKPYVRKAIDAIDSEKSVTKRATKKDSKINGQIFYRSEPATPPAWVAELKNIAVAPITGVVTASSSGVLVLKVDKRWFAVSFGYGRALIDPAAIERQFGLKVALNQIDPSQLRSMDTKTFEDLVVSKSVQSSKSSELPAFGVDVSRDILRGVAGVPTDKSFASRLHGSDAITLVRKTDVEDIPALCIELLTAHASKEYKSNFAWIDQLALISDPTLRADLDAKLLQQLKDADLGNTYMAAPEVIDWENVSYFKIAPVVREATFSDLDLERYIHALSPADLAGLTLRALRSRGVYVKYSRSENTNKLWSVYQCLISEQRVGKVLYVLIEGQWFKVDASLSTQVDTYFRKLEVTSPLPDARPGETEPAYNARIADEQPDRYLMLDTKIVRPGGASSGIEFCDLLCSDGTLVHVKRKSRSSTLSHLFAQGSVSARTLVEDGTFRTALRKAVVKALPRGKATPWLALIPKSTDRVEGRSYVVSYLVLAKAPVGQRDWMPFFSKLNLMQHGKDIERMGFKLEVSRVSN
ncbi:hypothetical protein DOU02_01170 [Clavibacter michiganensis subsp. michiganensis]|uniref:DUF6119 family protein n=1 Tax=Clavibacter michiganensis TaxID=28447 RepID=UPI0013037C5E|nr:DUF6119 family protein [Clavibacter michiganensis]KAF0259925.1 hypothetical protein DOU02_01170 [Clavibacter michiganensis subsp. michiganensis]